MGKEKKTLRVHVSLLQCHGGPAGWIFDYGCAARMTGLTVESGVVVIVVLVFIVLVEREYEGFRLAVLPSIGNHVNHAPRFRFVTTGGVAGDALATVLSDAAALFFRSPRLEARRSRRLETCERARVI